MSAKSSTSRRSNFRTVPIQIEFFVTVIIFFFNVIYVEFTWYKSYDGNNIDLYTILLITYILRPEYFILFNIIFILKKLFIWDLGTVVLTTRG